MLQVPDWFTRSRDAKELLDAATASATAQLNSITASKPPRHTARFKQPLGHAEILLITQEMVNEGAFLTGKVIEDKADDKLVVRYIPWRTTTCHGAPNLRFEIVAITDHKLEFVGTDATFLSSSMSDTDILLRMIVKRFRAIARKQRALLAV